MPIEKKSVVSVSFLCHVDRVEYYLKMFSPSLQLFRKKSIMCWGNDRTTFAVKETTLGPTNVVIHKKMDLDGNKFESCIKLLWAT